jgi:hypothetical protein
LSVLDLLALREDYRIALSVSPLEIQSVHIAVLTSTGLKFGNWDVVAAKGFKNYW